MIFKNFGFCYEFFAYIIVGFNTIINIITIRSMFNGCLSLISLPDISKWNTNNGTDMDNMFYE